MMKICSNKKCSLAGVQQPLDCFHKDKSTKDGYHSRCITCSREYCCANKEKRKEYREANKDKLKEYKRVYYIEHKEHRKEEIKEYCATPKGRYVHYKARSKHCGLTFEIDLGFATSLFLSDCHYCGEPPVPMNGIDRVDSDIGYTKTNCVACCWPCNQMKMESSSDEFIERCMKIIQNHCSAMRI